MNYKLTARAKEIVCVSLATWITRQSELVARLQKSNILLP